MSTSCSSLVGWTPHPTIKLIVGQTKEIILIHKKVKTELSLDRSDNMESDSIPIENVDPQCLRILLNFIYNRELNLNIGNAWSVLVTCWQFNHIETQTLCIDFIVDNLMEFDSWEMWRSAKLYKMKEMITAVENYAAQHLEQLKKGKAFAELSLDEVLSFFKSEEVCRSSSRETRSHAAISWIEHDIDSRQSHISCIMSEVNLYSLPIAIQNGIINKHPAFATSSEWIKHSEEIAMDIDESSLRISLNIFENSDPDISIEDYVVKIEQEDLEREIFKWPISDDDIILDSDSEINCQLPDSNQQNLSMASNDTLIVISEKQENDYRAVWSYDVVTKNKTMLAYVEAREDDAFLCRNNVLYHLGGRKGNFVTKDVYSLKLLEQQLWEPCPPMTVSRCYFSVVVMKGDIYAIGGNIGEEVMNTVDVLKFDGETCSNLWEPVAFLNRSRDAYGAAVDDENTIYVVGGCGQASRNAKSSSVLALVEEFPGPTGLWSSSRRLRHKRMFHCVVFLNGYIYAIGGFDGSKVLSSVECFDGNFDGKWSICTSLKVARKEMHAIVFHGRIYVFGGKGANEEVLHSSEVYDPFTKKWSMCDILPEDEGTFHSVLVKR